MHILLLVTMTAGSMEAAIPYFARRYNVPCSSCHSLPPRLNAFGESFRRNGYRSERLTAGSTVPLAVWVSSRYDALPAAPGLTDRTRAYVNRIEVVSGGRLVAPWLTYFVEWRPLSFEARGDGSLRDRSGRFEDLFVIASAGAGALTVGQFRQVDQVDVSLRSGVSEPLVLATSLPGEPGGSAREVSLRAFSPSGRSPSVRASWTGSAGRWRWVGSAAVPLPGEFSLPLTDSARVEASNEITFSPKGVVVEAFVRRGVTSYGAHAFYDHGDRYLAHGVVTGHRAGVYWTGIAGLERLAGATTTRWSAEVEYFPGSWYGAGARLEHRELGGNPMAWLPYVSLHFPGTRYTLRFTAEQRIQQGRHQTLVEVGAVF